MAAPHHPTAPGHQQASHWGTYTVTTDDRRTEITGVSPWTGEDDPSPLLANLPGSVTHPSRITGPAVRRGWWEDGPGPSRHRGTSRHPGDPRGAGPGDYLHVGWDEVLDRLADELRRVVDVHGNHAIYAGSYGWASAGRFHHAQSQVHRFLNGLGGYTPSIDTYSTGALEVFLPRIVCSETTASQESTPWPDIVEHTQTWLALGGVPVKNTGTDQGGTGRHPTRNALESYLDRGGQLIAATPWRGDLLPGTRWIAPRPGSDTALLLALCHTLIADGLVATRFVTEHTVGYDELAAYLRGEADGIPKDAAWAAAICHLPAETITALAHELATTRSLVTATWSLQRQQYGEMLIWAVVALASLLGGIGPPGRGFGFGYGSMNKVGSTAYPGRLPALPQGTNPVSPAIPVAAVSDLLLHPGRTIPYDGGEVTFPDIRLLYWAGGNPFHHHQDLGRLRRAMARPDTVVVHDPYWTPMARHADIVLPSTTAAERDDLTGSRHGALLVSMAAAVTPHAAARNDYDTFAALAERLGFGAWFTEGRDAQQWLRHLYDEWATGSDFPSYEDFRRLGVLQLPTAPGRPLLADFRSDPYAHPLSTPSGRIELASSTIAALGLPDCPGLPTWFPPDEWAEADRFPLHLIADQPRTRLHSQLDHGAGSMAAKVAGREPVRMHPSDAAARGITDGDLVRIHNRRGHCLAGAVLEEGMTPGVVNLSTGAWYDPADPGPVPLGDDPVEPVEPVDRDVDCDPGGGSSSGSSRGPDCESSPAPGDLDVHGNPNVLTADRRTSSMAQGCTGQLVMVEIERWRSPAPPVRAHQPPC